jgi:FMN reductase
MPDVVYQFDVYWYTWSRRRCYIYHLAMSIMESSSLLVVGIGGTVRPESTTESALDLALKAAEAAGADVVRFCGAELAQLPIYSPTEGARGDTARELIESVRRADGVIIASPGYHASISGLVKNALDYLEDLRADERPYLSGRGVGCIATGAGWQATVTTLTTLRTIVHALRGWPTPLGAAINTDETGAHREQRARFQLETIGADVVEFALMRHEPTGGAAPATA